LGELSIKAYPKCFISQTHVFPDVDKRMAVVKLKVENRTGEEQKIKIVLSAKPIGSTKKQNSPKQSFLHPYQRPIQYFFFNYPMGESPELWSEFNPALYQMKVRIETPDKLSDIDEVSFGMRKFVANGTQFQINGNTIILRGKNDSCIFPLTGHPPMDTTEWCRYFKICKDYGINHVRFHSWCPPQAAFIAADMVGIYLQAELPYWGSFSDQDSSLIRYMKNEGTTILEQNGNSPSFCMFTLGNENSGSRTVMDEMIGDFKAAHPRQLYSFGTNSIFMNPKPGANDDFWVTVWTNGNERTKPENHVRAAFATNEDETSGLINAFPPSTNRDYTQAIQNYKQDYPGQATALVGILDPFMDSKGIIEPAKFREFCSEVVPLAKMPKYCYYNTDTLKVEVCIANYGLKAFGQSKLIWQLSKTTNGPLLASGELSDLDIPSGQLTDLGKILIPLNIVSNAEKLLLAIQIDGTPYKNEYPVWVYPGDEIATSVSSIVVADKVDANVLSKLEEGKNVLLFPNHQRIKDKSLNPQFINEFWNWYMFQGICQSNNRPCRQVQWAC
jgi:hypothetical protein